MTVDVVYLAYYNKEIKYDIKIVKRFLDSYKALPAGKEHSLVVIAKNWTDKKAYEELQILVKSHGGRIIDLPDDGYDFGAYFRVSKMLKSEYVLFLGSSIEIAFKDWLLKLYRAFESDESFQLVGAMGSWGDSKRETFPNYHVRTCSFMIKRELFLEYASTQTFPTTKEDTYEMEHGKTSLTNFIFNKGFNAVIVNCDGNIFMPDEWAFSQTFRSPHWKSLFADKQSLFYLTLDEQNRASAEIAVWGQNLKDTKTKIFTSFHKIAPILVSEVFQPIFSGIIDFKMELRVLRDGTLQNIADKNGYYGELTKHYWVWKNYLSQTSSEYIGFCHYKRYLDFNLTEGINNPFETKFILDFNSIFDKYTDEAIYEKIKNYDAVVPKKYIGGKSIYDLYLDSSPKKDIDLALGILQQLYPEYVPSAQKVLSGNELYACLVFVMKKELVNEYMSWMFNILFALEEKTTWEKDLDEYGIKIPVNIAEVFFNIWLAHNIETKNLQTLETTSILVDSNYNNYLSQCLNQIKNSQTIA